MSEAEKVLTCKSPKRRRVLGGLFLVALGTALSSCRRQRPETDEDSPFTPMEEIIYHEKGYIPAREAHYTSIERDGIFADNARLYIDPDGVTFYEYERIEGILLRHDDRILVAVVEPGCDMIPVLCRVQDREVSTSEDRLFYSGGPAGWNATRDPENLPIELQREEIVKALESGCKVYFSNFGSSNTQEYRQTIVAAIQPPEN